MSEPQNKMSKFKQEISQDKRKLISTKILKKYPDRIPIIVEPCREIDPKIKRRKFLVPSDVTMGFLIFEIRKYMDSLNSDSGITFYVHNRTVSRYTNFFRSTELDISLVPISRIVSVIYNEYKDEDGFLYLVYAKENIFG